MPTSRIFGPEAYNYTTPAWRFQFRGRTVGVIVLSGFGAYSMYGFILAEIPHGRKPWLATIAVITAIFVAWSIAHLSLLRRAPKLSVNNLEGARLRRFYLLRFGMIVTIESVAIVLGGPILGHFHRGDLLPQWIDAVVGIHFFPLAKLFNLPLYNLTGAAIVLAAFGPLLIPPGPLRDALTAGGSGLSLWITGFIILSKNLSCLPAASVSAA